MNSNKSSSVQAITTEWWSLQYWFVVWIIAIFVERWTFDYYCGSVPTIWFPSIADCRICVTDLTTCCPSHYYWIMSISSFDCELRLWWIFWRLSQIWRHQYDIFWRERLKSWLFKEYNFSLLNHMCFHNKHLISTKLKVVIWIHTWKSYIRLIRQCMNANGPTARSFPIIKKVWKHT